MGNAPPRSERSGGALTGGEGLKGCASFTLLLTSLPWCSPAELPVERGLSDVMRPPNDVLAMGTDRTWADAIHYLRWEEELGKKYEAPHG